MISSNQPKIITPEMTILDIVSRYRETEAVFKRYDKLAGACLCCQSLFESIADVSLQYGLNIENLLSDLEDSIALKKSEGLPKYTG
jgi:hypothetical protein